MVQIIKESPSFGAQLGKDIGSAAMVFAQHFANKKQQKKASEYFAKLKEQHPGDKNYELLSDFISSPLESSQKRDYLKAFLNVDPYRAEQQERLRKEGISQQYNRAIKELDNAIEKRIYPYGSEEYKNALNMRHALAQERDQILGFARKGMATSAEPEEMAEEEEVAPRKKITKPKRVKFDPQNPKHKARRDQVLKKTRGDRAKAGVILSKEFEL